MKRTTIIPVLLLCVLGHASDALAWGRGHRLIRLWALERLPAAAREFIGQPHLTRLCSDYLSLQDRHAGGNAPELDPYCMVPGVRLSLHDVNPPEPSAAASVWFLEQIIGRMRSGEMDQAMKYLGVLCHWHEDPGCPSAHCSPVREDALKILLPPPPDKANLNYLYGYGGIADCGTYEIADVPYEPRRLGDTVDEAALRMYQHQRLLERRAAARIVPLVQDTLYGQGDQAKRHRAEAALENARHIADVIHTVVCLARETIDASEPPRWQSQRLTEWLPDARWAMIGHPYYVTPFLVDQAMDAQRQLHPLAFSGAEPSGQVEFGYGMGAPYALEFTLAPGRVFERFTCRVGLHPTAGPDGEVAFVVAVDGSEVHRTEPIRSGQPPASIDVALPQTDVLRLSLQTHPTNTADSRHNLTVWAEPLLHRRSD
jgi:hypothetical protein